MTLVYEMTVSGKNADRLPEESAQNPGFRKWETRSPCQKSRAKKKLPGSATYWFIGISCVCAGTDWSTIASKNSNTHYPRDTWTKAKVAFSPLAALFFSSCQAFSTSDSSSSSSRYSPPASALLTLPTIFRCSLDGEGKTRGVEGQHNPKREGLDPDRRVCC